MRCAQVYKNVPVMVERIREVVKQIPVDKIVEKPVPPYPSPYTFLHGPAHPMISQRPSYPIFLYPAYALFAGPTHLLKLCLRSVCLILSLVLSRNPRYALAVYVHGTRSELAVPRGKQRCVVLTRGTGS